MIENGCGIEGDGKRLRCPTCERPHRLDSRGQVPLRECVGKPRPPGVFNDLSQGPCVHRAETLRTENCRLCGRRQKRVEIFACGHPQVATEVSEERWRIEQPRNLTCSGCNFYEPRKGPPTPPPES